MDHDCLSDTDMNKMDPTDNVATQIAELQLRVGVLAVACFASWVVLALLATFVALKLLAVPEVIRAHRLEADQIESEILTANTVSIKSPEAVADSLPLGGGRTALQDPAGNNRVLINGNGLRVGNAQGNHALFLGLNPGPGKLRSPFLVMRDRTSEERLTLGLNAENDWPFARLRGTANGQVNGIMADSTISLVRAGGSSCAILVMGDPLSNLVNRRRGNYDKRLLSLRQLTRNRPATDKVTGQRRLLYSPSWARENGIEPDTLKLLKRPNKNTTS